MAEWVDAFEVIAASTEYRDAENALRGCSQTGGIRVVGDVGGALKRAGRAGVRGRVIEVRTVC